MTLSIFVDPFTWNLLQQRFGRPSSLNSISDIYDGKAHNDFLQNKAHVSLALNTDGVAIFRSSKVDLWPVWLVINELPKTKRYDHTCQMGKELVQIP